ncbi:alpha/beta hydrolase [Bradyrhizobium septentrionale]|uniref:Alpha/beta hydrolase n=1 Tax=Bradyrhizobium septentrionale TaxID=1404411 RepID=A0A973VVM3_9BRAD|nr:alpha/beta hydrolase [Bradyrhizobium septentrionale]UGY20010.1 alpha/beta hydrolase [Bradyrhizobium septentrionale]UGY28794.1 alpha/beta hydrolase [Bradyrhizobium septentrionale]
MIQRRHVFHIGGYDPITPEEQVERLRRSLSSFEKIWGASSRLSEISNASAINASCNLEAWGPNWKTCITFEMLRWDDLIRRDSGVGLVPRLVQSTVALFDFILTGTVFRYAIASWKYALFFLFPYCCLLLIALCSAGLSYLVVRPIPATFWVEQLLLGIFLSLAIFISAVLWIGPKRRINHILDDAIFSHQFLYGRRSEVDERLNDFAAVISRKARAADVDEILIVGHSLGAALSIAAVARALNLDPLLETRGPKLCILTIGATIPKFSLHPMGHQIREAAQLVAGTPAIGWVEYQARDDAISFYRFDPVTLKRIGRDHSEGRPKIRRVQIHSMVDPIRFRRHRFNFMQMHYQFLMGNDRRSVYDYCVITCGPLEFNVATSPSGAVELFEANGSMMTARN